MCFTDAVTCSSDECPDSLLVFSAKKCMLSINVELKLHLWGVSKYFFISLVFFMWCHRSVLVEKMFCNNKQNQICFNSNHEKLLMG